MFIIHRFTKSKWINIFSLKHWNFSQTTEKLIKLVGKCDSMNVSWVHLVNGWCWLDVFVKFSVLMMLGWTFLNTYQIVVKLNFIHIHRSSPYFMLPASRLRAHIHIGLVCVFENLLDLFAFILFFTNLLCSFNQPFFQH